MKNCLLTAPLIGAFWLIFLFVLCFLGVHLVRLAKIGWKYQKDKSGTSAPPPSERKREGTDSRAGANGAAASEKKDDEPAKCPPEPVYYIVERKRKRSRDSYSPPKEIRFK